MKFNYVTFLSFVFLVFIVNVSACHHKNHTAPPQIAKSNKYIIQVTRDTDLNHCELIYILYVRYICLH